MSSSAFEAVTAEPEGNVRIVVVSGELDLGTAPALEVPLAEAVEAGAPLLIDLSGCDFIDSTGIALIVRAWQRLGGDDPDGESEGPVAICSASQQVRRVLEITGLERSIPVHASRDEALAALRG